MALERTLSIVKPDGVARNLIGQVIGRFEKVGLKVVAARMVHLSQRDAEGFYAVHAALVQPVHELARTEWFVAEATDERLEVCFRQA